MADEPLQVTRLDVVMGVAPLRPEFAVRVTPLTWLETVLYYVGLLKWYWRFKYGR
jgi:hypothetical protein